MANVGWIVARTKSQRELWAAENLSRQGFEYYLPRIQEIAVRHGRKHLLAKPLFPSYIFVLLNPGWHSVLGTFGISSILIRGDSPEIMPTSAIQEIRASERNGFVVLPERQGRFTENQKVRVTGGPFEDQEGLWQSSTGKERERVLLSFLGRKTTILIPSKLVIAA